jgi:hypothetical protein
MVCLNVPKWRKQMNNNVVEQCNVLEIATLRKEALVIEKELEAQELELADIEDKIRFLSWQEGK